MTHEESLDAIETIKQNMNIVEYVGRFTELKPYREMFVGRCPLHNDKSPSFYVDGKSGKFKCYGCGNHGDIIDFVQLYHHLGFEEAIDMLLDGKEIKHKNIPKIIKDSTRFKPNEKCEICFNILYENCMDEFPKSHHIEEWIKEGISENILEKYNVRYNDAGNKIVFPIYNCIGNIISIKYRDLQWCSGCKNPKYGLMYKIGVKNYLYNYHFAEEYISGLSECVLVESEKSCMKLETWGIKNSLSVGCHYLSDEQIKILVKTPFNSLIFAYDKDVKLSEITEQTKILNHYKVIYYIPVDELCEKEAPVDEGFEMWSKLYNSKIKLRG